MIVTNKRLTFICLAAIMFGVPSMSVDRRSTKFNRVLEELMAHVKKEKLKSKESINITSGLERILETISTIDFPEEQSSPQTVETKVTQVRLQKATTEAESASDILSENTSSSPTIEHSEQKEETLTSEVLKRFFALIESAQSRFFALIDRPEDYEQDLFYFPYLESESYCYYNKASNDTCWIKKYESDLTKESIVYDMNQNWFFYPHSEEWLPGYQPAQCSLRPAANAEEYYSVGENIATYFNGLCYEAKILAINKDDGTYYYDVEFLDGKYATALENRDIGKWSGVSQFVPTAEDECAE